MIISLENAQISATFSTKGGELQRLENKETALEYLWTGDANFWGKFSPILFPIVGGLKEDTYFFEEYPISYQGMVLPETGSLRPIKLVRRRYCSY